MCSNRLCNLRDCKLNGTSLVLAEKKPDDVPRKIEYIERSLNSISTPKKKKIMWAHP